MLHKIQHNAENPIAIFSQILRDAKLKYGIMEKQAYALIKYLKYFRVYILQSHVIGYVPNNVGKNIPT